MNIQVKKRIANSGPVKGYKIVTNYKGEWYTGPLRFQRLEHEWMTSADMGSIRGEGGHGFYAFKSRGAAQATLHRMARTGFIKGPSFVVQCYLRGMVEFGKYLVPYANNAKGMRGAQMLIKKKHMPVLYVNALHSILEDL
jgi:hypothetical protein